VVHIAPTKTALDQFITEGANEVINAMPRSIMERVAEETTFTNTVFFGRS
jgi:hypothetical protein